MVLKEGQQIFYKYCNEIVKDTIKEVIEVDGHFLITPSSDDYITLSECDLLDDTNKYVCYYKALDSDKSVPLKDAINWLNYYARNYYEPDSWSFFDSEKMVIDFCNAMCKKN